MVICRNSGWVYPTKSTKRSIGGLPQTGEVRVVFMIPPDAKAAPDN